MIKRLIILIFLITISFSVVSGCTSTNLSSNPEKLTDLAIQQFINENQLQDPLAVDFISEYGAVVIYDGYIYEIWSGGDGLISRKITSSNSSGVLILGSTEGTPYIAVAIMDREIQNQGESMTVYFDNGVHVTKDLHNRVAFAIPFEDGQTDFDSLEIYDSEGQVIYRN